MPHSEQVYFDLPSFSYTGNPPCLLFFVLPSMMDRVRSEATISILESSSSQSESVCGGVGCIDGEPRYDGNMLESVDCSGGVRG